MGQELSLVHLSLFPRNVTLLLLQAILMIFFFNDKKTQIDNQVKNNNFRQFYG